MKCKQLALRVLSTAAILSIVSSIAAPVFAETYYIGNGYDLSIEAKGMARSTSTAMRTRTVRSPSRAVQAKIA